MKGGLGVASAQGLHGLGVGARGPLRQGLPLGEGKQEERGQGSHDVSV